MEPAESFESRLDEICATFGPFALGWRAFRFRDRIFKIRSFLDFNSETVIPLDRRRKIAADAKQLLESLDGLGGLDDGFIGTLQALALNAPDRSGHGGDRRSGQHTLDGSALRMIVRLYIEAHAEPGFSKGGPLSRFVGDVCALLGIKKPSDNAIKAVFNGIRPTVRKFSGRGWYNQVLK